MPKRPGTHKPNRPVTRRHATRVPGSWRSGKTTAQRGYGGRWQRLRLRFLKRNPLCTRCQALGLVVEATVVDHIVPHEGDSARFWDESNWQALCKPCHDSWKKQQENRR